MKKKRRTKGLLTLDDFLEQEGMREVFQAVAIKEVIDRQITEAACRNAPKKPIPTE